MLTAISQTCTRNQGIWTRLRPFSQRLSITVMITKRHSWVTLSKYRKAMLELADIRVIQGKGLAARDLIHNAEFIISETPGQNNRWDSRYMDISAFVWPCKKAAANLW